MIKIKCEEKFNEGLFGRSKLNKIERFSCVLINILLDCFAITNMLYPKIPNAVTFFLHFHKRDNDTNLLA